MDRKSFAEGLDRWLVVLLRVLKQGLLAGPQPHRRHG
jgi:hypothetical protein